MRHLDAPIKTPTQNHAPNSYLPFFLLEDEVLEPPLPLEDPRPLPVGSRDLVMELASLLVLEPLRVLVDLLSDIVLLSGS